MKRYIIAALIVVFAVCSCTEKGVVTSESALFLDVTRDEVLFHTDAASVAFSMSWKFVGGQSEVSATYVQFAADSNVMISYDMENSYLYEVSGNSHAVLYSDIKSMMECFGKHSDFHLLARVLCDTGDGRIICSNTVPVFVRIDNTPSIETMYLCGMSHSSGWTMQDNAGNRLIPQNGEVLDVYAWTGYLSSEGTFRFNTKRGSWFPAIVIDKKTKSPVYVDVWDENLYDQFTVEKGGQYHIEVDIRDINNISVSVEPAE